MYAQRKRCWLISTLALENDDPSYTTFWTIFVLLSPTVLEQCLRNGYNQKIERRYYISSLPADALRVANAIRGHWGIENRVHWILEVAFREDEQNANAVNIAENMSMIRRLSLNLLKQEKTAKRGIEIQRQMAGWDDDYLLKVLGVKSFS